MSKSFHHSPFKSPPSRKHIIKAPELTKDRLNTIISKCGDDEVKRRLVSRHEQNFVPEGDWTLDQKLAFIICAIPGVGKFDDAGIITNLLIGPAPVNQENYPGTHVNMLRRLKSKYPETARQLAELQREHKHVPYAIKSNDDWCCLTAFTQIIIDLPGPWIESTDPDDINQAVREYIDAAKQNFP